MGSRELDTCMFTHYIIYRYKLTCTILLNNNNIMFIVDTKILFLSCCEEKREKLLVEFIRSYVSQYLRPENPSPILLYGDHTPESQFHTNWLAKTLEKIQMERKTVSKYTPEDVRVEDPQFDYFEHFCFTIADRAKEIWILE